MTVFPLRPLSFEIWPRYLNFTLICRHFCSVLSTVQSLLSWEGGVLICRALASNEAWSAVPDQKLLDEIISVVVIFCHIVEWEQWITHFFLCRFHRAPRSKRLKLLGIWQVLLLNLITSSVHSQVLLILSRQCLSGIHFSPGTGNSDSILKHRGLLWQGASPDSHLCSTTPVPLWQGLGCCQLLKRWKWSCVRGAGLLFFFSNCLSLLPVLLLRSSPEQSDGVEWLTLHMKVMEELSSPKKMAFVDLWKVTIVFPCFLWADLVESESYDMLASEMFATSHVNADIFPDWEWSFRARQQCRLARTWWGTAQ